MQPINKPNAEEKKQKLGGDIHQILPDDHQAFETNIDSDGAYNNDLDAAGDQVDQTITRPTIRMSAQDSSHQNGPVRIIKPAFRAKIYGED